MRVQLAERLQVLALRLTAADLAQIDAAVPAHAMAGDRYPAPQLAMLDSEQPHASS